MKKIFTLIVAAVSTLPVFANLEGDGYYRVENYKTNRYASVIDNRGSIDIVATTADLQAIRLWRIFEDVSHDPASIFYIDHVGDEYQLTAQGTGIYQIIGHYLRIRENGSANGQTLYMAYGTNGKATRYLGDGNTLNRDYGSMSTNCTGDYRKWYVLPVEADSDNFFGAYPDVDAGGGLYTTIYADFPFSAYSEGVKMYYVSNVGESIVELTEIDGTVPAATPVVVECVGTSSSDNRLNVGGKGSAVSGNKLVGQYFNCDVAGHINRIAYNPETMRVLGRCKDGSLGFIKAQGLDYIPANTAYIRVPGWYSDEMKCVKTHDAFLSGVDEIGAEVEAVKKSVYTMTGVLLYDDASEEQISSLPKGLYIIGGKKVRL
ncbi:MAG: hypothetical protein K2G52_07275 [Muribaculaceae bacterium]|nr:hypothetical protein [Muribaculaceae bacterium]